MIAPRSSRRNKKRAHSVEKHTRTFHGGLALAPVSLRCLPSGTETLRRRCSRRFWDTIRCARKDRRRFASRERRGAQVAEERNERPKARAEEEEYACISTTKNRRFGARSRFSAICRAEARNVHVVREDRQPPPRRSQQRNNRRHADRSSETVDAGDCAG